MKFILAITVAGFLQTDFGRVDFTRTEQYPAMTEFQCHFVLAARRAQIIQSTERGGGRLTKQNFACRPVS